MIHRLFLLSAAIFWVTMMTLLWRAEFAGTGNIGSEVHPNVVWDKILTAPDDSTLSIGHRGRNIGYCRWIPNIGEAEAGGKIASENTPEGRVEKLTGYTLTVEGSYLFEEPNGQLRFVANASLATNYAWRTLDIKGSIKPTVWAIQADAGKQQVAVRVTDGPAQYGHTFRFADLSNPAAFMAMVGMPALPLPGLQAQINAITNQPTISLGLDWKANNDWIRIGPSQVRVYRLSAQLLDRYKIVILVSRVGEILRIELPNDLRLVNDALLGMSG